MPVILPVRTPNPPAPGVEYSEADLGVFRFEKTLKQGVPCNGEQLVDRVGPDGSWGVFVTEIVIGVLGQ